MGRRNAAVLPLPVIAHGEDVPAREGRRDGVGLNRRRPDKPELLDSLQEVGMKLQAAEWH